MTICERMFEELDRQKLTAYGLCKALGVNTNTTSTWKKNNTDPPSKYIARISKYLNCSLEYLLTGQEAEKIPSFELTDDESEMLELFQRIPYKDQQRLIGRLQQLVTPLSAFGLSDTIEEEPAPSTTAEDNSPSANTE